jgi:hemolysin III
VIAVYEGERFNSISHLAGAIAGLAGLVTLIIVAAFSGDPWKMVSFSIYGVTLLFLYVASTLYHSTKGKTKAVFKILDYHGIYLLIAGTYTPFALVTLRDSWGWLIFGIIWTLAIAGIILDSVRRGGHRIVPLIIYLVMGWLIVVALKPLLLELSLNGVLMLFVGGLCYTVGVVFFIFDHKVSYFHGVWHLFVLCGSGLHYFTVIKFIG